MASGLEDGLLAGAVHRQCRAAGGTCGRDVQLLEAMKEAVDNGAAPTMSEFVQEALRERLDASRPKTGPR